MKKAPLLDIVLPFSDLWMMVKHQKKLFLKLILLFASLAFIVVLSRTPTYGTHGLLQVREEGGNKEFNFGTIFDMKRSAGSFVANPSPFLTSSNILYPVIDKLNLQAVIVENSKKRGLIRSLFTNFKENLILLYWSVQKKNTVALPDKKPPPFECTNILFDEEVPTSFLVNFNSLTQFSVSENTGLFIGQGELGTPFNGSRFSFVLQQAGILPLNSPFLVTLYPKKQVVTGLSNKLTIEVEKLNPHYFNISYTDRDRHLAANITNAVMDEYQTFLNNEVANSFEGQVEYLNKRQEQIQLQFDRTLESKKEKMKKWVGVSGYLSYTNGEKYLAENQEGLNNRKVHLDYEIKKIKEDGSFISKLMDYDDSHRLNVLLKK